MIKAVLGSAFFVVQGAKSRPAAGVEGGVVVVGVDEGSVGVLGLGGGEAGVADAEVFVPDSVFGALAAVGGAFDGAKHDLHRLFTAPFPLAFHTHILSRNARPDLRNISALSTSTPQE